MDSNWWKQALGTMTHGAEDYQQIVDNAGDNTLVIVDFFMPNCGYCVKFMPEWNRIVAEF